MTTEQWLAAQLAAAPPLTARQTGVLRPVFHAPADTDAAPARQQEPRIPALTQPLRKGALPMPHDNSIRTLTPPSARIGLGRDRHGALLGGDLHYSPVAGQIPVPGTACVILGWTDDGQAVTLATTSLEWLDDLEAAIQHARAQGVVQAGMVRA